MLRKGKGRAEGHTWHERGKDTVRGGYKRGGGQLWLHAFSPSTLKGEAGGSLLVPDLHHKTVFSKRGSSGDMGRWEMEG